MASDQRSASGRPAWANRHYRVVAFDLWSYYSRCLYIPVIRIQIDFDRHLDEAVLAEAFEQSCVTFPLIACVFDTTPPIRPRWTPRREAAREILQVVETRADTLREDEIQRVFAGSPDISKGPQLCAFLVRDSMRDSLCLTINHMLCDAAGFKQYLREVARLYSRIVAGLDPSPAPFDSQRSILPVLKRFTPLDWLLPPPSALGPSAEETEEFQRTARFVFGSGPFSLLTESLSAKNFKPVRAAAKTLGFTVNDLFMASLALAWYRVCGMDRVVLPCTIDMRNFIPLRALRGITNLSSDCPCLIQITPDDTLEDIMAKVVEPMKVYKQGTCAVSKSVSWEIFTRRVSFRRAKQRCQDRSVPQPLSATNVGIIDEDCVRFSNVSVRSAYLFAPAPPFLSYLIALSTFRGELTLSTSIEGDEEMKAFARSILTAMIEELMAFGSRHSAGSG